MTTDPALLDADPDAESVASVEPMETDEALFETVDNQRVAMPPMSYYATQIAATLFAELYAASKGQSLGRAAVETLFRLPLTGGKTRNRRPDVAFVSFDRWPADRPSDPEASAWDVVPDLAVEVISPGDLARDQREKVLEYFEAGARLVWVVYPTLRLVDIFETPKQVRVLSEPDELGGGDVVPGFRLPLATLFGQPAAPGTPQP